MRGTTPINKEGEQMDIYVREEVALCVFHSYHQG